MAAHSSAHVQLCLTETLDVDELGRAAGTSQGASGGAAGSGGRQGTVCAVERVAEYVTTKQDQAEEYESVDCSG